MIVVTLFPNLPILSDRQARAVPKGASRLEEKVADVKQDKAEERRWRRAVRIRDKGHCRWCQRKTVQTIENVPERGETHHLTPREVLATRWHEKNGVHLCQACHQKVTGKVNERFVVVAAKTFTVDGVKYPSGAGPLSFKRVA